MDKKAIKNFAVNARKKLIDEVTTKAKRLGINESGIENAKQIDSKLQEIESSKRRIQGKEIAQRNQLIIELNRRSSVTSHSEAFQELIEEVAYTWFNRVIAIRFMEVNDYLPDTYRVLSSETSGKIEPDIITEIYESDIYEELSINEQQQVQAWKTDNSAEAMDQLYQLIFVKICNQLNDYLPELFEKVEDYTELLFTASYIKKDGVIADLLNVPEADFNVRDDGQVEIIGWLYQYYNSEPKDQVFARPKSQKVRKQDIPAVTQLFTPDWIVRYMVENSLGRFYIEKLLGKGDSRSEKEIAQSFNWEYYLETAEQPESVVIQLKQEQQEKANYAIENIHFIDPSMGSGHILVYAFEVFMQLYENEGYSAKEAASLILEKNLFGLDIDQRAKQLAYFALMMKGREYNRQILRKQIQPNVFDIPESKELQQDQDFLNELKIFFNDDEQYENLIQIIQYFTHGKDYGSLIKIPDTFEYDQLIDTMQRFGQKYTERLFAEDFKRKVSQLVNLIIVTNLLSNKYEVVVTNPPYMGSSGMDKILSDFAKKNYPNSKSDLFAMFIEQCEYLTLLEGYCGMITQQAWMFLSSFQKLRVKLVERTSIINMANLGARAFEEIGGEVVQTTTFIFCKNQKKDYIGSYIRLVDFRSQVAKQEAYKKVISSEISDIKFVIKQENFKKISGVPIAYWASENVIRDFVDGDLINEIADAKVGLQTGDNDKFLRYWFEVEFSKINFNAKSNEDAYKSKKKWFPTTKGGSFRRWYGNNDYVVNWENDGYEMKNFLFENGKQRSVIRNPQYYFKKGMTWSTISSGQVSFRLHDQSIFETKGSVLFPKQSNNFEEIFGYVNSKLVNHFLTFISPTLDYHEGPMGRLPFIKITSDKQLEVIKEKVNENINLVKKDYSALEIAYEFKNNNLVNSIVKDDLQETFKVVSEQMISQFNTLKHNEETLNEIFIKQYSLESELIKDVPDEYISSGMPNKLKEVKNFISYSIGNIFGRYSLDKEGLIYAGGEWDTSRYQKFKPDTDNVLLITDDEYFKDGQYGVSIKS